MLGTSAQQMHSVTVGISLQLPQRHQEVSSIRRSLGAPLGVPPIPPVLTGVEFIFCGLAASPGERRGSNWYGWIDIFPNRKIYFRLLNQWYN